MQNYKDTQKGEGAASFNPLKAIGSVIGFIGRYRDEIWLLALAGFLFFVASNTQSGWLYYVVSLIVGLLAASLVQSLWNFRKLRIVRRVSGAVTEDARVTITLIAHNDSRFSKYLLLLRDDFPSLEPGKKNKKLLIPYIAPKSSARVTYKARCYHRGTFRFGKVQVESTGLLGFFYMKRNLEAESPPLIVFPRNYRIDHFLLDNVSPYFAREENTYMFTGKSHDFLGIREYEPGQEIRYVHWPSSAKQGKLMVKEFKEIATHSLTVLLDTNEHSDMGRGRDTTGEDKFRVAASLLEAARKRRYTFDLIARSNGRILNDHNISTQKGLYRLAELECDSPHRLEEDLFKISGQVRPLDHIFILKTFPFENLESLRHLLEYKVFLTVIFFSPSSYLHEEAPSDNPPQKTGAEENEETENSTIKDKLPPPEIWEKIENLDFGSQAAKLREMGVEVHIFEKGGSLNKILKFKRHINAVPSH